MKAGIGERFVIALVLMRGGTEAQPVINNIGMSVSRAILRNTQVVSYSLRCRESRNARLRMEFSRKEYSILPVYPNRCSCTLV